MTPLLCDIYKSPKKDGAYLFVDRKQALDGLPAELLDLFGKPVKSMTLALTPEKKLARVDISKVIKALGEKGYYLQLPPPAEEYMQEINIHNSKLV